jgi:hypothetical protein
MPIAVAALLVHKPVNHRREVGEDFVACLQTNSSAFVRRSLFQQKYSRLEPSSDFWTALSLSITGIRLESPLKSERQ